MKKYFKSLLFIYLILSNSTFAQHSKEIKEKAQLNKKSIAFLKECNYNDYLKIIEDYLKPLKNQEDFSENINIKGINNDPEFEFVRLEKEKEMEIKKIISKPYGYNMLLMISNIYAQKGDFENSMHYIKKYKEIIEIKEKYLSKQMKLSKEMEDFLLKFGEVAQLSNDKRDYEIAKNFYDFYKDDTNFDFKFDINEFNSLYRSCKENIALNLLLKKDKRILEICKDKHIESETYYCSIAYKIFGHQLPLIEETKEENGYKSLLLKHVLNETEIDEIEKCLNDLPLLKKIILKIIKK